MGSITPHLKRFCRPPPPLPKVLQTSTTKGSKHHGGYPRACLHNDDGCCLRTQVIYHVTVLQGVSRSKQRINQHTNHRTRGNPRGSERFKQRVSGSIRPSPIPYGGESVSGKC